MPRIKKHMLSQYREKQELWLSGCISKGDVVVWYNDDNHFGYLGLIEEVNSETITIFLGNYEGLRLICKHQQFKYIHVIDHLEEDN